LIDAGRIDFVAVPTQDRDRAERFYAETIGLRKNPNSTETWVEYETDNVTLALVAPEKFDMAFEPLPFGALAIRVPDVAEARKTLEEAGLEFKGEIWDSGVCHGAAFRDTEGNGLLIHHRYAPYLDGREP
jgi:catechol 2,3-dioxygenase-like lactoylglutathione lyase family enzyme